MSHSSSLEHLNPGDWERLREAAEKLEEAWRDHTESDLASFLPAPDDPLYGSILEELVKTDLEIRRNRGQPITLDFYLEKYPELGNERTLPARLIFEEYLVLRRFGEPVDLEHYRRRFPDQFAELQRLVGLQQIDSKDETNLASDSPSEKPPPTLGLRQGDTLSVGEGYRLIKRVGSGSFGEVWEVEAPGGFPAAMKIIRRTLDGEEAKRELRALEVIKRLSHPHLLKTQAAWPLEERLVIVMELADCTLRDRLQQCKEAGAVGIPVAELLRYFQEAAEALDYLHSEDVLHRDVKPQNLLLCHGHVKVADFGLVREQKQHRASDSLSGTPGYMGPEAWGRAPCTASDQYSLALTYAELRLGRWPFSFDESPILVHLEGTPDLSRLGEAERSVLLRGVAKNWKERFPTCQALVSALRDALPGDPAKYDLPAARSSRSAPATRPMPRLETKNIRPAKGGDLASPQTRPIAQFETKGNPQEPTSDILQTLVPPQQRVPDEQSSHEDRSVASAVVAVAKTPKKAKNTAKTWQWITWTAVVLLLMAGIAVAVWIIISQSPSPTRPSPQPSFELLALQPERVILSAGTGKALPIRVERKDGFQEAVKVEALTEGAGLKVGATVIAPESDKGEVRLDAVADAVPGLCRVNLHATANGQPEKLTSLQVVILPFGFEPKGENLPNGIEMPYPSKIVRRVGKQKVEVVFVLIRPEGNADAPFYLMESKVSNGMFRAFVSEKPQEVSDLQWKQGGVANGRNVGDEDELPVFRLTRPEAERCAAWLGGRLPSARQLDEAAGCFGPRNGRGPARGPLVAVRLGQLGPRKITDCGDDVSPLGIHALSGNGREWTRDNPTGEDGKRFAILRGKSYMAPEPLSFAELNEWINNPERCPVQRLDHRSWTTGFRVVIELSNQSDVK